MYPLAPLLEHAIDDVRTFNLVNLFFQLLFLLLEVIPVILLNILTMDLRCSGLFDWVILLFLFGLGLALHAEEDHLLLTHLLDSLTRQNASDSTLNDLSRCLLGLLLGRCHHLSIVHTLSHVVCLQGGVDLLQSVKVTTATLSTSFVLLDQPNGLHDVQIVEVECVVGCFFDSLCSLEALHENVVDLCLFLIGG